LSNGVTDTLESSAILMYLETCKSINTQKCGEMPSLIKWLIKKVIKMVANSLILNEWKGKMAEKGLGGKCMSFELQNFKANAKVMLWTSVVSSITYKK
jgi:hypothetical protein